MRNKWLNNFTIWIDQERVLKFICCSNYLDFCLDVGLKYVFLFYFHFKIIQTVCGKTVSADVVIAMSGMTKVFVGEIVELGKQNAK